MQKFEVKDRSNDHRYFTQMPNVIYDTLSGEAQTIYGQMKKLGGEGGEAYAGNEYYRQRTGWGLFKIKKAQKELCAGGYIVDRGVQLRHTKGGPQNVHVFEICDVWEVNILRYSQRGYQNSTPLVKGGTRFAQRGYQNSPKGVPDLLHNKIDIKQEQKEVDNVETEDQNARMQKLENVRKSLIEKGALTEVGLTLAADKKRMKKEEEAAKLAKAI